MIRPSLARTLAQAFALAAATLCLAAAPPAHAGSAKKGLGAAIHPDGAWKHNITAVHARWFYSWGGDEPKDRPRGIEFVPMDWGYYGNEDNGLVNHLAQVKAQPNIHALLGFNEPDGKDQANLTVEAALEGWQYLQATGLPLGSPAAVHADGAWMQSFMAQAAQKHDRVDFVTVHWYGWSDPQSFLAHLAHVHDLYHLPIWVTEFAPADWSGQRRITPAQVAGFMRVVLPALNKLDYVQRYAWFSASPDSAALGASSLFNKDGTLTEAGRIYAAD